MQNSKYSKVLTIALIVIVVLIIGLLIFWGVSALNKKNIESDANEVISAFNNRVNNTNTTPTNQIGNGATIINPYNNLVSEENIIPTNPTNPDNSNGDMKYKGFTMLGYIEIPKTNVNYPVLEEANMKALETSVAVLHGPGLNKVGNTVIVGHNYRNGTFFSDNAKLSIGDKIYITDATGEKVTYTITKKYQTTPEDADYANRDTAGAREITLSTCTDDSGARIVIWAKAD